MQKLNFLCLLFGAMLFAPIRGPAQDLPPLYILRSIAAKLPHRPQTRGTSFQLSGWASFRAAFKPRCGAMMLATGSSSAHTLPVLSPNTGERRRSSHAADDLASRDRRCRRQPAHLSPGRSARHRDLHRRNRAGRRIALPRRLCARRLRQRPPAGFSRRAKTPQGRVRNSLGKASGR